MAHKLKLEELDKPNLYIFSLDSVLFVPGCPFNLISISKLTQTLSCLVTFVANWVLVQERNTWEMVGVRCEFHGLYYLTPSPSPVACVAADPPVLLHHSLGHPSLQKLQRWYQVLEVYCL